MEGHYAETCRMYGASVVVMAFDENGQADTLEKRVNFSERAYKILTEKTPESYNSTCLL